MAREFEILKYCSGYSINKNSLELNSSIRLDMGLNGDDALWFLKDFGEEYHINLLHEINFANFFHSEYELFKSKGFFKIKNIREIETELKIADLLGFIRSKHKKSY